MCIWIKRTIFLRLQPFFTLSLRCFHEQKVLNETFRMMYKWDILNDLVWQKWEMLGRSLRPKANGRLNILLAQNHQPMSITKLGSPIQALAPEFSPASIKPAILLDFCLNSIIFFQNYWETTVEHLITVYCNEHWGGGLWEPEPSCSGSRASTEQNIWLHGTSSWTGQI